MIEIVAFCGGLVVAFGAGLALGYKCGVADERAAAVVREMRRACRRHPAGRLRPVGVCRVVPDDGEEGA